MNMFIVSQNAYDVFKVLSEPRKIEFCLDLLLDGEDVAKENIMKKVTIPKGSPQQRIISIRDFKGNNIEVVSSYDDLHLQSNSKISIKNAVKTLLMFGEILYEIKNPKRLNQKVFRFRKIYRRITAPGIYYPMNLN